MQYICRSCTFMQVIYILCNNMNFEIFFCRSNGKMGFVWLGSGSITASYIVEIENQLTVCIPCINGSNILNSIIFPKTDAVSECLQAAYLSYSGDCKYNNVFTHTHFII